MKQLILSSILGLAGAFSIQVEVLAAQSQSDAEKQAADRYVELEKEAKQVYDAWVTKVRTYYKENPDAGRELPEEFGESPYIEYLPLFQAGAKEFAGSESAVPYLTWVVLRGQNIDLEASKAAFVILVDSHAASEGLEPLARSLKYMAESFDAEHREIYLSKLEFESSVPAVRAWSGFILIVEDLENSPLDSKQYVGAKQKAWSLAEMAKDDRLLFAVESTINLREKFGMGMLAPDIVGVDLDGVGFKLSDYEGKVIFLDFWGDW